MSSSEDLNVSQSEHNTDENPFSAEEQEQSSGNESSQSQVPEAERRGVPQREEGIDNDQLIPPGQEIPVMPEVIHLSSVFQEGMRMLGERLEIMFTHIHTRFQEVNRRLDLLEAEVQRPQHHFFSAIERGVSDLPFGLQLNVMEACQAAYSKAKQQSQTYGPQSEYYPSPVTPSSPTHTQSSQLDTPKVHNITPSDRPRT
ncbi:uncharacterized protein LOC143816897 [Ranitomeya variabilis]|uniref:uncharacterized protein LOC143816897 n=1 Tax=Ranitomeya variabilis TaxID=490064 RepID=UPI0040569A19